MTIEEAVEVASVLGNRARLTIVQLLLQSHPQGLIVGQIQRTVGIPGPTLSHHLERLRDSGLVSVHRQGTFLWYLPVRDRVRAFADLLLGPPGAAAPEKADVLARPGTAPEVQIEFD